MKRILYKGVHATLKQMHLLHQFYLLLKMVNTILESSISLALDEVC